VRRKKGRKVGGGEAEVVHLGGRGIRHEVFVLINLQAWDAPLSGGIGQKGRYYVITGRGPTGGKKWERNGRTGYSILTTLEERRKSNQPCFSDFGRTNKIQESRRT